MNEYRPKNPYRLLAVFFALAAAALAILAAFLYRDLEAARENVLNATIRDREHARDLERAEKARVLERVPAEVEPPARGPSAVAGPASPDDLSLGDEARERLSPARLLETLRRALSGPISNADDAVKSAGVLDGMRPLAERLTADPAVAANAYFLLSRMPGVTIARITDLYTRTPLDSPTVSRAAAAALTAAAEADPANGEKELERLSSSGLTAIRRLAVKALANATIDPHAAGMRLMAMRNDGDPAIREVVASAVTTSPIIEALAPLWRESFERSDPHSDFDPFVLRGMIAVAGEQTLDELLRRIESPEQDVRRRAFSVLTTEFRLHAAAPDVRTAMRLLLPMRRLEGRERANLLETYRRFRGESAIGVKTVEDAWCGHLEQVTKVAHGEFTDIRTEDAAFMPWELETLLLDGEQARTDAEAGLRNAELDSLRRLAAAKDNDDAPPAEWWSYDHVKRLHLLIRYFDRLDRPESMPESAPNDSPADVDARGSERIVAYLAWAGYRPAIERIALGLDGSRAERSAAVRRLMRTGFASAEAAAERVVLGDDPYAVNAWLQAAMRSGARISSSAIRRILIRDDMPRARNAAAMLGEALVERGDPDARAEVSEILLTNRTPFEAEIIGVCAMGGEPKTWPIVRERITAGDARLREAALRAAAGYELKDRVRELTPLAKDESPLCRAALANVLAAIDDPNATSTLYVLSHDSSEIVREAAVLAIARNPGSRGIAVLKDRMDDPDREVKNASMRALVHLGDFDRIEDLALDSDDVLLGPRTRRFLGARFGGPVEKADEWIKWWRTEGRRQEFR